MTQNLTPLMKQYWDIKSLHADKILLFRMGDFFEMFHDDAVKAAPILGIALTQRNKKSQDETPMCGMPHHSIAGPINKLLSSGLKVAICDQIEDPKLAKGLVKRAVTRILTPGMVYDSDTLSPNRPHYMAALDEESVSFVDTTSGEAFYVRAPIEETWHFVSMLEPVELVVEEEFLSEKLASFKGMLTFHENIANAETLKSTRSNAESLKAAMPTAELPKTARRLLSYCQSLAGQELLRVLRPFEERPLQKRLHLSPTVVRHLELFETYEGHSQGSFFDVIDRTKTSIGRRLLRSLLAFPYIDLQSISKQQDEIKSWLGQPAKLKTIREGLFNVGDLERRIAKISSPQCNARDLAHLSASLLAADGILRIVEKNLSANLQELGARIEKTFVAEPPLLVRQGYMIQKGVSPQLDEWIDLSTNSQQLLSDMEEREKKETGISSLKIRYNNVFGYYIEVTHTHKDKVPARYLRKQTLANAERFYTEELLELEKKVLSAQTRRFECEYEIFEKLRQTALAHSTEILQLAQEVAKIDVSTALSWLALEKSYCLPEFSQTNEIALRASRHPVVESSMKSAMFVANDITIAPGSCVLLTGPNMAGKSTLMRQVALTVILGQIGGPVPAAAARLPVLESIFTRIGASDQLSQGLSTFMVEMKETAEMLKDATAKSLVVLDEVGRGTSTYDGLSLAQSILEFLVREKKTFTLFATHYHELTGLESEHPQVLNYHMAIGEKGADIKFLHSLRRGPARKSYGIQVAKLAGLPEQVTQRALTLLSSFEKQSGSKSSSAQLSLMDFSQNPEPPSPSSTPALSPEQEKLLRDLEKFEISNTTPLQALSQIAKWQEILSSTNLN